MSADEVDPEELGEEVERPMYRLFTEYGGDHYHWFVIGLVTSLLSRLLSLVPPLVLGVAIDAVFRGTDAYDLYFVPQSWIPTTQMGQFWFSAEIMGVAMVLAAFCNFARSSSLNLFSHRVKHEVRTSTYQWMQRLDMTFFDDHKTGELMSVLNNDANRLELFLDNMMGSAVQLLVLIIGIGTILFLTNPQLALVTMAVIPVAALFTWWFMKRIEKFYAGRSVVGRELEHATGEQPRRNRGHQNHRNGVVRGRARSEGLLRLLPPGLAGAPDELHLPAGNAVAHLRRVRRDVRRRRAMVPLRPATRLLG